jgi:hypothetical protein
LWLWTGTEIIHVVKRKPGMLHDTANEVWSRDGRRRFYVSRRRLYRSEDEAERELALRVLGG